jgi:large subunit ribosomal protein L22
MARTIAPDAQQAIATARFIRMSPSKARQVVDLIRGRHVDEARRVLAFTQRGATLPVRKVLESAIANAEHNRSLAADELFVARAWVDEGPTLRRFRPRAMGRATRINKRTCHISVVVGRPEEEAPVERPRKRSTRRRSGTGPAKKTTARKKTTRKKTTAKKTTAKKTTAKKTTAKKTTAKSTAKKTTAKKTTKKKTTEKPEGESN